MNPTEDNILIFRSILGKNKEIAACREKNFSNRNISVLTKGCLIPAPEMKSLIILPDRFLTRNSRQFIPKYYPNLISPKMGEENISHRKSNIHFEKGTEMHYSQCRRFIFFFLLILTVQKGKSTNYAASITPAQHAIMDDDKMAFNNSLHEIYAFQAKKNIVQNEISLMNEGVPDEPATVSGYLPEDKLTNVYQTQQLLSNTLPNITVDSSAVSNNSFLFTSMTKDLIIWTGVKNNGSGSTGEFKIGYYLSRDSLITTTDLLIGSITQDNLEENASVQKFCAIILDTIKIAPGDYFAGIIFDYTNQVTESDENDNHLFYKPSLPVLPNLTAHSGLSANEMSYDAVSFDLAAKVTIQNNGTGTAGRFKTAFYLSRDRQVQPEDISLAEIETDSLDAGAQVNFSLKLNLDSLKALAKGTYFFIWIIDNGEAITESDENDNRWYFRRAITYQIESTRYDIAYEVQLFPGQKFDGWWYFWTGDDITTGSASYEEPGVEWLSVSPRQFISTGCSDIVPVKFSFTAFAAERTDTVVIRDTENQWGKIMVIMETTRKPDRNIVDIPVAANAGEKSEFLLPFTFNAAKLGCVNFFLPDTISFTQFSKDREVDWLTFSKNSITLKYGRIDTIKHEILAHLAATDSVYEIITRQWYSFPSYFLWKLAMTTDVESRLDADIPADYNLYQNYPNPFNPVTQIAYSLPIAGAVELEIFNASGQSVKTLVNEFQPVGNSSVFWDGTDNSGQLVSAGLYFYRLHAGEFKQTKKLLLVR